MSWLPQNVDLIVSVLHWIRRRRRWRRSPSHHQVSITESSRKFLSLLAIPASSSPLSMPCSCKNANRACVVYHVVPLLPYFEHAQQGSKLACVKSRQGTDADIFAASLLLSCYVIILVLWLWLLRRMNSYDPCLHQSTKRNCFLLVLWAVLSKPFGGGLYNIFWNMEQQPRTLLLVLIGHLSL